MVSTLPRRKRQHKEPLPCDRKLLQKEFPDNNFFVLEFLRGFAPSKLSGEEGLFQGIMYEIRNQK